MSDCAVLGCKPEPGASIHNLPRNPVLKQKWMDFIYRYRLSRPSNTMGIHVCGAHFSSDSFTNYFQRSMGYAKKLKLKPDAVPCIYPGNPTGVEHEAGALCLKRADVACQCNPTVVHEIGVKCSLPKTRTRTVGTQLSQRTLIYRRSMGVQTRLPATGAGAEQSTSEKPPSSPPPDWSEPVIEDDDRCVTVVSHLLLQVFLSWRNQVLLSPQYCRNVDRNDREFAEWTKCLHTNYNLMHLA